MGEVIVKVTGDDGKEVEQKLDDKAVQELMAAHGKVNKDLEGLRGTAEGFKPVADFMTKYNLDPQGLVDNADGAFALVNKLIEDGVIDTSGNVIKKGEFTERKGDKGDTREVHGVKVPLKTGDDDVSNLVTKAVKEALSPLAKGLEEVTLVQTSMLRNRWEDKIRGTYPNLTEGDISRVFSEGAKRPKDGLLDIAREISGARSKAEGELRARHAAEFGVNLEEFDANKLKEKGSEGGAAVIAEGKKFTLSKRRAAGDPKLADPAAATREYFRKQGILK